MKCETFTVIPGWVDDHIQGNLAEIVAYSIIYGFSQDGSSLFMGTAGYLAKKCHVSTRQIMNILKSLVAKGYIEKIDRIVDGESRPCYRDIVGHLYENKTPDGGAHAGETKSKLSNTECTESNNCNDSTKQIGRKSKAFVPPTLEEVRALWKEKGYYTDPDEFFRYWNSTEHKWNQLNPKNKTFDLDMRAARWEKNDFGGYKRRFGATSKDSEQVKEIAERRNNDKNDYGY